MLNTIGGLLPIVFSSESEFWQTLATVVVWGLGSSTILLLLLMGIWESLNFKK
jgi:multidrug efflux pump subunit AcrB